MWAKIEVAIMYYENTPKESSEAPGSELLSSDELMEYLRPIKDPDIGASIVDLGLLYKIENKDGNINIDMTFTTPACPYGPQLMEEVRYTLSALDSVKSVNIEVVWDPPWSMENISEETRLELGLDL